MSQCALFTEVAAPDLFTEVALELDAANRIFTTLPVVGTVYFDKYELPKPYPERIRVTIEVLE